MFYCLMSRSRFDVQSFSPLLLSVFGSNFAQSSFTIYIFPLYFGYFAVSVCVFVLGTERSEYTQPSFSAPSIVSFVFCFYTIYIKVGGINAHHSLKTVILGESSAHNFLTVTCIIMLDTVIVNDKSGPYLGPGYTSLSPDLLFHHRTVISQYKHKLRKVTAAGISVS